MYRFVGQPIESKIPSDFKTHRLQKQFVPEQKIHYLSNKKMKQLKTYLNEIITKIDPFKLGFDIQTIPPPPKFTQQTVYPRGDNVHP